MAGGAIMHTELTVAVVSPKFLQDAFGNGVSVAMSDRVPHITDLAPTGQGLMRARTAATLNDVRTHEGASYVSPQST
jgi:hypothetical protein